jgi:type IV secretion system protein TrbE
MTCPDALLLQDLIVFPHVASRGYALALPDLRHASPDVLNHFSDAWQHFLLQTPDGMRLQVQTTRDNDLAAPLKRYSERTAATPDPWSRRVREERFCRYEARLKNGTLFRQRVILFLCMTLEDPPTWLASPIGLESRYRGLLKQVSQVIEQQAQNLGRSLAPFGATLTPLDDAAHHRYFAHVLNPTLAQRPDFDLMSTFDPARSVHSNCWWSEGQGQPFGFLMDGYYHTLRVATRWPVRIDPLTLQPLCVCTDN